MIIYGLNSDGVEFREFIEEQLDQIGFKYFMADSDFSLFTAA